MLGMKQEVLADELGDDWTQKKVSLLEAKESIEPEILDRVAKVLKVPAEAIRNFSEEAAINIIANTINNHDQGSVLNYYPTFNPINKIIELYERLLAVEREKIEILQGKTESN